MDNNMNNDFNGNSYQDDSYQKYEISGQPQFSGQPQMEEPVGLGEFFLIAALTAFIPCAGIILLFIYGFSNSEKQSKKNFCRALLIIEGIKLAFFIIFIAAYGAIIAAMISSIY